MSASVCASYAMRGADSVAGSKMQGDALGILKSMRHSLGRRDEDQPINGAGGAIPTSITAIRYAGGAITGFVELGFGFGMLLQKSSTQGDVLTRSALLIRRVNYDKLLES